MEEEFIFQFKKQIIPFLVYALPQEAFEKGGEEDLLERIVELIISRLEHDKIPISQELRQKVITEFIESIPALAGVSNKRQKIDAIQRRIVVSS